MKCNDFQEIIDSYLCDELLTETNHDVLRHLEQCAVCRRVIESRRALRGRLRSAVLNSPEFQVSDQFKERLRAELRQSVLPEEKPRRRSARGFFGLSRMSFLTAAAAAAGLIFVFVLGIIYLQNPAGEELAAQHEVISLNPAINAGATERIALGDHLGCAVNHDLEEAPVKIDLSAPGQQELRQNIVQPLVHKTGSADYKLIEAHECRYLGHDFTHLIFSAGGSTLSVILLDVGRKGRLETDAIAHFKSGAYRMARFDAGNRAVFVISDLPARKNAAAAELLFRPLRRDQPDQPAGVALSDLVYRY